MRAALELAIQLFQCTTKMGADNALNLLQKLEILGHLKHLSLETALTPSQQTKRNKNCLNNMYIQADSLYRPMAFA